MSALMRLTSFAATVCLLAALALGAGPANDRFVTVARGVQLFVHEEGRGTPVIAIHGGPGLDLNYLAPDLQPLAEHHRVIYYDQRGSGRSTLTSGVTANVLVADLEALRERLALTRVALLGHSWGGGLAALYAVAHPGRVSRLVLVDPMPLRVEGLADFAQNLRSRLTDDEAVRLREASEDRIRASTDDAHTDACRAYWSILFKAYYSDPAAVTRSRGQLCLGSGAALANGLKVNDSVLDSLGNFDWRPKLAGLRVPTLVVHGDDDPIPLDAAREWTAAIRGSRLVVVPKSGHIPFIEQPELFFRAVGEFLAGRWPPEAH